MRNLLKPLSTHGLVKHVKTLAKVTPQRVYLDSFFETLDDVPAHPICYIGGDCQK